MTKRSPVALPYLLPSAFSLSVFLSLSLSLSLYLSLSRRLSRLSSQGLEGSEDLQPQASHQASQHTGSQASLQANPTRWLALSMVWIWGEGIKGISISYIPSKPPHYKESSQGTLQAPAISISAAGDPADTGTLGPLRLRASQPETRTLLVDEAADPSVGLKVLGFRF